MIDFGLDPVVVGIILAMSLATYATKAGGLWLLGHIDVSPRLESALKILPGAIIVSIVGPELANGGPAEWSAAAVVLIAMRWTENVLVALLAGVATVLLLRALL